MENLKSDTSHLSQTCVKADVTVPVGHIICSTKWKGTELWATLQGYLNPYIIALPAEWGPVSGGRGGGVLGPLDY